MLHSLMMNRSHARWTTTLAAAASLALAAAGSAQTQTAPPSQPAPAVNQELVKQQLTTARNTLSEVTQLPAAAQLTGQARTLVQQLISNFNELITTGPNWRASYAKVESNLAALLGPEAPAPAPASGTAGAVGTSGTTPTTVTLDPAIRDMLVEFRAHLKQFERVASGGEPATPPTPPAPTTPMPAAAPPASATDDRPDSPSAPPGDDDVQAVTGVAHDVLLHVEAVEVILGAQTAAQKTATAAAGGAVVSSETASGSTKTTINGPNVTLNPEQLDQITTHLKEIRRLLGKK